VVTFFGPPSVCRKNFSLCRIRRRTATCGTTFRFTESLSCIEISDRAAAANGKTGRRCAIDAIDGQYTDSKRERTWWISTLHDRVTSTNQSTTTTDNNAVDYPAPLPNYYQQLVIRRIKTCQRDFGAIQCQRRTIISSVGIKYSTRDLNWWPAPAMLRYGSKSELMSAFFSCASLP